MKLLVDIGEKFFKALPEEFYGKDEVSKSLVNEILIAVMHGTPADPCRECVAGAEMKVELTVPIDENTTFPIKILTEDQAIEMVLKALGDVRAGIEALKEGISSYYNDRPLIFKDEALAIIDNYKIESEDK